MVNSTPIKKLMKTILILFASFFVFSCTSKKEETSEWITLFDGGSTDALRGYKLKTFPNGIWNVNNGILETNPDTTNIDIITTQRFKNFDLEYEWAVDTAANSGVFFHVQEKMAMESGNGNSPNWLENFEIQVLDDQHFNDTAAIRSAGSLYDLIIPVNKNLKAIGEFNQARIFQKDGHVEHWLNGQKVLDFQIGSQELKNILAKSKFKDNPDYGTDTEGHIMFQHHGQKVYYKNIRIKEL